MYLYAISCFSPQVSFVLRFSPFRATSQRTLWSDNRSNVTFELENKPFQKFWLCSEVVFGIVVFYFAVNRAGWLEISVEGGFSVFFDN